MNIGRRHRINDFCLADCLGAALYSGPENQDKILLVESSIYNASISGRLHLTVQIIDEQLAHAGPRFNIGM